MTHTIDDPVQTGVTIKDLDTGAEMTLEEFEIFQKMKAERVASHDVNPDVAEHLRLPAGQNADAFHDHQGTQHQGKPPLSTKGISKAMAWVKKKVKDPLKTKKGSKDPHLDEQTSLNSPPTVSIARSNSDVDSTSTTTNRSPSPFTPYHHDPDEVTSTVAQSPATTPRSRPLFLTIPALSPSSSAAVHAAFPATPVSTPAGRSSTYRSSKSSKELADIKLAQEWKGHEGQIWAMAFSRDGKYLASGGQDGVVRVWEVQSNRNCDLIPCSPDNTAAASSSSSSSPSPTTSPPRCPASPLSAAPSPTAPPAPVLKPTPFREFLGHTEDILDLAWSQSRFLASASVDQSIRLWHLSLNECLRVFWHPDFVTSVAFHPVDPQLLASGSIDGRVRLWSVPESAEVSSAMTHDMVTALAWDNSGKTMLAGTMKGRCRVYNLKEGTQLDYLTQLDVRHQNSSAAGGKKITGIVVVPGLRRGGAEDRFLITSNDSRLRLYNSGRQFVQECKYKGHKNSHTQIRASVSPAGDQVACGSDDGWVYVWDTVPRSEGVGRGSSGKNSAWEAFRADDGAVTAALFGPASCKEALLGQGSGSSGGVKVGGAVLASTAQKARAMVMVVGGASGMIKVFENIS